MNLVLNKAVQGYILMCHDTSHAAIYRWHMFDTFGGIVVEGPVMKMLFKFLTLLFKHSGQISAFLIYCLTPGV